MRDGRYANWATSADLPRTSTVHYWERQEDYDYEEERVVLTWASIPALLIIVAALGFLVVYLYDRTRRMRLEQLADLEYGFESILGIPMSERSSSKSLSASGEKIAKKPVFARHRPSSGKRFPKAGVNPRTTTDLSSSTQSHSAAEVGKVARISHVSDSAEILNHIGALGPKYRSTDHSSDSGTTLSKSMAYSNKSRTSSITHPGTFSKMLSGESGMSGSAEKPIKSLVRRNSKERSKSSNRNKRRRKTLKRQ
ncbi:hypothetical protein Q1695_009740 [Nippostrongylus brasiliensis]|nr:hypothetical protein Q1695_009740 [Nippostrongylus brasiliensis]